MQAGQALAKNDKNQGVRDVIPARCITIRLPDPSWRTVVNQTPVKAMDPERIPELPVTRMNSTHHDEVALVNRIARCLGEAGAPCDELDSLLTEWVTHTEAHFGRENRWMQTYGFPAYPIHAGEHERVLGHLRDLCARWRDSGDTSELVRFVNEEWPRWFEQHLAGMDTVTAQFLAQAGGPDLE